VTYKLTSNEVEHAVPTNDSLVSQYSVTFIRGNRSDTLLEGLRDKKQGCVVQRDRYPA
jgi:hypothetical protein